MNKKKTIIASVGAALVAILSIVTFGIIKKRKNQKVEEDEQKSLSIVIFIFLPCIFRQKVV